MDCECTVRTTGSVALVEVSLRNRTPVARRVRVENRLAGPVLPPRTEGLPEAGWDREGVSVVVSPHETRALGYACPLDTGPDATADSPPTDPPAAVVADERAPESDGTPRRADVGSPLPDRDDADRSVEAVVRALGRSAPPRDAVPAPAAGSSDDVDGEVDIDDPAILGDPAILDDADAEDEAEADADAEADAEDEADLLATHGDPAILDDADAEDEAEADADAEADAEDEADLLATHGDADPRAATDHPDPDSSSDDPAPEDALPPPVAAWLASVERRVEAAERLDADTAVPTATSAVRQIECSPAALPERLATDHTRLVALAARIEELAGRAESASVPADDVRRLS